MGLMTLLKVGYEQPAIAILAIPAIPTPQGVESGDKIANIAGIAVATTSIHKTELICHRQAMAENRMQKY